MIELSNVSKTFKQFQAVRDLSFHVDKGEIVGLLGENGAGKTTTLRMMATTLMPTSGTIKIGGYRTDVQPDAVRRTIGILFGGESGLYDRLTARENIMYFAGLYRLARRDAEAQLHKLTEQLRMEDYIHKRVGTFSKGMRQKVAIARSLIHNPEVVLFDEPTSGLDITSANQMRDIIRSFQNEGKTVVFSSHIMGEVKRLCDRVIIIHKGSLVFAGTLRHLYDKYETEDLDAIFMALVGDAV